MIDGVKIKKLKVIEDDRGRLMEILRCDDSIFKKFGQAYMTTAKPGFVKAWHYHKKQTDSFTCVKGRMRLVLYDGRKGSKTKGELQEFVISPDNPLLVQIPPFVYHGFESADNEEAVAVNVPDFSYNHKEPDEFRLDPFNNDIPYKWKSRKGG